MGPEPAPLLRGNPLPVPAGGFPSSARQERRFQKKEPNLVIHCDARPASRSSLWPVPGRRFLRTCRSDGSKPANEFRISICFGQAENQPKQASPDGAAASKRGISDASHPSENRPHRLAGFPKGRQVSLCSGGTGTHPSSQGVTNMSRHTSPSGAGNGSGPSRATNPARLPARL